ncbi:MAG: hypothetical protein NC203_04925 [Firmicutes bacterium]|nr:hypothetical protein [[Eubacterium] siraeum]MCM1487693.1 hypothetical protein [Bacillota bacterium]
MKKYIPTLSAFTAAVLLLSGCSDGKQGTNESSEPLNVHSSAAEPIITSAIPENTDIYVTPTVNVNSSDEKSKKLWAELEKEQAVFSGSSPQKTVRNYLYYIAGDESNGFVSMVIDDLDDNRDTLEQYSYELKSYGIDCEKEGLSRTARITATYHAETDPEKTSQPSGYCRVRISLIRSDGGGWYIPSELQEEAEYWTQEGNWEKIKEDPYSVYADNDPMRVAEKIIEDYAKTCLSFTLEEIYFDEEQTERQRKNDYIENYKNEYGIADLNRVQVITVSFDAKLDPDQNFGKSSEDTLHFTLMQDSDGVWYAPSTHTWSW